MGKGDRGEERARRREREVEGEELFCSLNRSRRSAMELKWRFLG